MGKGRWGKCGKVKSDMLKWGRGAAERVTFRRWWYKGSADR